MKKEYNIKKLTILGDLEIKINKKENLIKITRKNKEFNYQLNELLEFDLENMVIKNKLDDIITIGEEKLKFSGVNKYIVILKSKFNVTNELSSILNTEKSKILNGIKGLTKEFKKILKLKGTGYKAKWDSEKKILYIYIGFTNDVEYNIPENINIEVTNSNVISIKGIDKELVGKISEMIRKTRELNPYTLKGIDVLDPNERKKLLIVKPIKKS